MISFMIIIFIVDSLVLSQKKPQNFAIIRKFLIFLKGGKKKNEKIKKTECL